jgi:hypothetical protein
VRHRPEGIFAVSGAPREKDMNFNRLALAALLVSLSLAHARAEVSRFDVLAREQPALQGRVFGDSGTVEKITARAMIALDPTDPHNAVIVDLDRAPRNSDGKVEASTDVVILRPAHPKPAEPEPMGLV